MLGAETLTAPNILAEDRGSTFERGNVLAHVELALVFGKIVSLDLFGNC